MKATRNVMVLVVSAAVGWLAPTLHAEEMARTATGTAAAYLSAMESSDLDAAEALFADESSIFESGGVEGTWQHYREHHIGPELDAIKSFVISRGESSEAQSADGSMAFVTWPIEYTIDLTDGRHIESRGTVTFVLEGHHGHFRIRHMHWSSRKKPAADG